MDSNNSEIRPHSCAIHDGGAQTDSRAVKRRMMMRSRSPEPLPTSTSIFGDGISSAAGKAEPSSMVAGGSCAENVDMATAGSTMRAEKMFEEQLAPEKSIDRLFGERVVTIRVGAHKIIWRLHENLLSSTSEFFRAAFNGDFKEATSDVLDLPEDDPQAFELFVRWLYARAMSPPEATTAANHPINNRAIGPPDFNQLFPGTNLPIQDFLRLYVLASKLMIEELENACTDTASRHFRVGTRRPDIRDVQYIYLNTPAGSGMQRLLRERLTLGLFRGKQHNPVNGEWREILNQTPDLGFDIVNDIAGFHWVSGSNAPLRPVNENSCIYHRHEKGEACRPVAI